MRIAFVMAAALLLTGPGAEAYADPEGNRLSLERNALRAEYRKVDRELAAVEDEIEAQEGTSTTVSGTATGVATVRNALREQESKRTARRNELRQRLDAIRRDFRQLTARAEHHYGDLPMWWGDLD